MQIRYLRDIPYAAIKVKAIRVNDANLIISTQS